MPRGFSLVEVLIASTLTMIAMVTVAQISLLSVRVNRTARLSTFTAMLALQKIEQLRALTWTVDAAGAPVSDVTTDTTVVPERSWGGTGLSSSSPAALTENTSGYCEFLDGGGRPLGAGVTPSAGAVFVRRWSIRPIAVGDGLVIQVSVSAAGSRAGNGSPRIEETRLVTVRTRKAR